MSKIFVLGDFNIDLVLYLDRLPQAGETLNAKRFFEGPGGKGSNQAIATARLGAKTTFFSAIGEDYYGEVATRAWQENGVNTEHVLQNADYQTAMALINVDANGSNTITVHQGANLELTTGHVDAVESAIAAADIVMSTLGIPLAVVERAFEIAKTHQVTTILNTAPATDVPANLLQLADYITPNETELAVITHMDAQSENVEAAARQLITREGQTVVVTLGEQGAMWVTQTASGKVPTFSVDVVDTVGAGDAFNAGLAVALAEGQSLADAIQFANAVGALSVTKIGAVAGMPYRADVDAWRSQN